MARLIDPDKKPAPRRKPPPEPTPTELPKIDVPVYDLVIPSTGATIKVRPFTVKEEKLLLMVAESKDMNEIVNTVMQVINNCIVSGEIDFNKLPFFDIDYIFIFLRAKSVGEKVELRLMCNNEVEGKPCGNIVVANLDISETQIHKDEEIKDDISLGNDKGVKMKYPPYSIIKKLDDDKNPVDTKTNIIINSIDYIYDKKARYPSKDFTKGQLKRFVEELTEENYKKLENFVDNFPGFYNRLQVKCSKCGYDHDVRYTDFEPFFT